MACQFAIDRAGIFVTWVAGAFICWYFGWYLGNKFDEMAAITNFIVQPLTFLSGTFYSINHLPRHLMIAALNPVFMRLTGFAMA